MNYTGVQIIKTIDELLSYQKMTKLFTRNKTMPNIKITTEVDGKQVPLENISTETFEAIKALGVHEKIPVARVGDYHGEPRLFLTLNDRLKERIASDYVRTIVIDLDTGDPTNGWSVVIECISDVYKNIKSL